MKHLSFWGAALFGLALVGCSKDSVEEPAAPDAAKSNFVLKAEIASDSRTTLDGMKVDWADGDNIYLVTADGTWGVEYSNDKPGATIADYTYGTNGFTNTNAATLPKLVAGTEYTFRALYAKASQRSYHRGAATTHSLSAIQTQDCLNPTAHIAENDALAGTFTATAPFREASVTMNHLYTLMEVDVKNETEHDLTVTELSMELAAGDDFLAGVYPVNFDQLSINEKPSSNSSSKITLTVKNGAVTAGASLPLYFVMAPLKNYSNPVILQVKDSDGYTYTKTVEGKTLSFEAGKYNKTGYTISEGVAPTDYSGTYAIVAKKDGIDYAMQSTPYNSGARLDEFVVAEGTTVTDNAKIVWKVEKSAAGHYTIASEGKYLAWDKENKNNAITSVDPYELTITPNGDGSFKIASATADPERILARNDTSHGFAFYTGSQNNELYLFPIEYKQLPALTWGAESATIAYDDVTEHTLSVTTDAESVSVAAYDDEAATTVSTWLTATYADGVLTYRATGANTTDAVRTAYIVATTTNANGSKTYTFPVTQEYKVAADAKIVTFDFTKPVEGWPTSKNTANEGPYSCVVDGETYQFYHTKNGNGIYKSSSYLMVNVDNALGLPAVEGYKLTNVVAKSSSGCSTTVQIGISTQSAEASYVDGGEPQKWATQNSEYTYTLANTEANKMYYLYVTNKNGQIAQLVLTYIPVK